MHPYLCHADFACTPRSVRQFRSQQERLIDAAASLFNRQGIRGTTLQDVAASVGLSTTNAAYYFRRKEDLALACFERMLSVHQEITEVALAQKSLESRIRTLFQEQAKLQAAVASGDRPELITFNEVRALGPQQSQAFSERFVALWKRRREMLLSPELAGIGQDELNARAYALTSQVGRLRAAVRPHEPAYYTWVADRFADVVMHGLGASRAWPAFESSFSCVLREQGALPGDAFVRAATKLFNELGLGGVSISRLAGSLKLTKGAFYHHMQNKDDVIAQCIQRSAATQDAAFDLAAASHPDAAHRILATLHALVRVQLSPHGPLLRTRAMVVNTADQDLQADRRRLIQRWLRLVVDSMLEGTSRVVDPHAAACMLEGFMDDATRAPRWVPGVSTDRFVDLWLRCAWLGIAR